MSDKNHDTKERDAIFLLMKVIVKLFPGSDHGIIYLHPRSRTVSKSGTEGKNVSLLPEYNEQSFFSVQSCQSVLNIFSDICMPNMRHNINGEKLPCPV